MATKRPKKSAAKTDPVPAVVAVPPEHHPETHSFAYRDGSSCMTCLCGAEQELRLVDGKAARMYRLTSTAAWGRAIDVCAKYVPPAPPKVEKLKARKGPGPLDGLAAALMEQYPEVFAPEIVDGSDVEKTAKIVDLSVACSPVLPHRAPRDPLSGMGDTLNPVECSPLGGDMYRVYYAEGPRDVSADEVKVMRARFLLRKGELSRALIEKDGDPVVKERWMKLYGHTFVLVTGRSDDGRWGEEVRMAVAGLMPIVFADNGWKRSAAEAAGYKVDVWIDDAPEGITRMEPAAVARRDGYTAERERKLTLDLITS